MNKKINLLKNQFEKVKNLFSFSHFILKKIISLHVLNKSSVFAIILCFSELPHDFDTL